MKTLTEIKQGCGKEYLINEREWRNGNYTCGKDNNYCLGCEAVIEDREEIIELIEGSYLHYNSKNILLRRIQGARE